MFKINKIAISCIIFLIGYNACLLISKFTDIDYLMMKALFNLFIFGFTIATSLFGLSNNKTKLDVSWIKVSVLLIACFYFFIIANCILDLINIYYLVMLFNGTLILPTLLFIFITDKEGNI